MTLPDLLLALTEIADRVSPEDRPVVFEALRRLRHGTRYVTGPWLDEARDQFFTGKDRA